MDNPHPFWPICVKYCVRLTFFTLSYNTTYILYRCYNGQFKPSILDIIIYTHTHTQFTTLRVQNMGMAFDNEIIIIYSMCYCGGIIRVLHNVFLNLCFIYKCVYEKSTILQRGFQYRIYIFLCSFLDNREERQGVYLTDTQTLFVYFYIVPIPKAITRLLLRRHQIKVTFG